MHSPFKATQRESLPIATRRITNLRRDDAGPRDGMRTLAGAVRLRRQASRRDGLAFHLATHPERGRLPLEAAADPHRGEAGSGPVPPRDVERRDRRDPVDAAAAATQEAGRSTGLRRGGRRGRRPLRRVGSAGGIGDNGREIRLVEPARFAANGFVMLAHHTGGAVATARLTLALVGRGSPEAGWIDRLGRALGVVWIVIATLASLLIDHAAWWGGS